MHIFIDTLKVKLEVQDGLFVLSDGDNVRKISPFKVRSINIIKHCTLTSYALMHAVRHEIPVMIYGKNGRVEVWCWSHKYGTIADVRVSQALYSRSNEKLEWIKELITLKFEEQISLIQWIKNRKPRMLQTAEKAIESMGLKLSELQEVENIATIRGVEGHVSKKYWEVIFYAFKSITSESKRIKRYADDIFNMSINYGYGILYGIIEASLLMNGLDPYVGLFHVNRHDKPALAFDHIEPFRPWVDKLVIKLLSRIDRDMTLSEEDETGQIWLTLEYRKLLIHDFFAMMEERAYLNGKRIKRVDHIHYLSQRLATLLKNKEI